MTDILNSITVEQIKALADNGFRFTIEDGKITGAFAKEKEDVDELKERIAELENKVELAEGALKHVYKWLDDTGLYGPFENFLLGKEEQA